MPAAVETEVTELPESRVRLQVQVPPAELDRRVQRKARELGAKLKIPGFRRGKVPPAIVIGRLGREAVLEEAVRETLASWYADALQSSGIVPIGDPEVDLGELPPQGQALSFSIEIGVLPKATLGSYRGLEVARREPQVPEQRLEEEVEAMRQRLARLESVQRSAGTGDFLVIDYEGELLDGGEQDGGERRGAEPSGAERRSAERRGGAAEAKALQEALNGRDQLVELGAGRLPEELERALIGAGAGDARAVEVSVPADGSGPLAGRRASLSVSVKEVKEKRLPELNDDFAVDAGFEDLEELRKELRERLEQADRRAAQAEFREAALDAAVAEASVSVPEALVSARAKEMWERMLHSLSHRGISREAYLKIDGRGEQEILAELAPDAERALKREAVITAIVQAEGIEPGEQELQEALSDAASERGRSPSQLVAELRAAGRLEELREDLAARAAIDLVAEQAQPLAPELARAREQLWTPESEARGRSRSHDEAEREAAEQAGARLWTPDR